MRFPTPTNGTIQCPVCDRTMLLNTDNCPACNWQNILTCLDSDELTDISPENYQEEVEKLLRSKGISIDENLKKAEENKISIDNKVKKEILKFPNGPVKCGIIFTLLSILMGDILEIIGWGFIFQQTALSVGFGMFGLGLILYGSFQLVILRLDKLIENKGSE